LPCSLDVLGGACERSATKRGPAGPLTAWRRDAAAIPDHGALKSAWGARRASEVERMVERVIVLAIDDLLIEQVAQLRNRCRQAGHALHQAIHNANLWVAAAAIRWGLPLVAHDAVFIGCPGLDLRTELVG